MYGIQKRTLKTFPCMSKNVCRLEDGNTNLYLEEPRAVEEFLRLIEPNYNAAVANLQTGHIAQEDVFTIAGFVSYIMSCAPAAMRQNKLWLAKMVESQARLMDAAGKIPPPPKELGGGSITELLENGSVLINVDGKYPQALGIGGIFDRTVLFGNAGWDILINDAPGSPFFTSDYPIAIETSADPRILNRIVPLTPDLAIRIRPTFEKAPKETALHFPLFRSKTIKLRHQEVRRINTLIVQCAEEQVYYRDNLSWVVPFIRKHSDYWIEPVSRTFPALDGELTMSSFRIARRNG